MLLQKRIFQLPTEENHLKIKNKILFCDLCWYAQFMSTRSNFVFPPVMMSAGLQCVPMQGISTLPQMGMGLEPCPIAHLISVKLSDYYSVADLFVFMI